MTMLITGIAIGVIAGGIGIGIFAGGKINNLESDLNSCKAQNQMYQKEFIENSAKRKGQNEKAKKRNSA